MQINKYWKEGRYVDLWSINHLLSGVVLGAILFGFGAPFGWSLLVAIVLFLGWEVAEVLMGIKEHMPNMVTDMVADLAGFLALAYWHFALDKSLSWTATTAWILVFVIMNIWGFIAYEERKIDEIPQKIQAVK